MIYSHLQYHNFHVSKKGENPADVSKAAIHAQNAELLIEIFTNGLPFFSSNILIELMLRIRVVSTITAYEIIGF